MLVDVCESNKIKLGNIFCKQCVLLYDQSHNVFRVPMVYTYPTFFGVNIILMHIPRHSKICHLTLLSFTNKNVSRRQVTMDNLQEMLYFAKIAF